MTVIAVPLGAILAFVMERTDFPGKRWIEPVILVPSFVSPMVLSFGYVVAAGPVGFYSVWATEMFGGAPWGSYSLTAHRRHRRPDARAERLHLRVVGAEEPRVGRRGSGARRRRIAVPRRA